MIIYKVASGTRTTEIDITAVSNWFKPYIGWVGDANGETLTVEARASFDAGVTWTALVAVTNRSELTAAFNETTESHADVIEVKMTLSTTDQNVSPWVDQVFIYFPDTDPYFVNDLPTLTLEINSYNHIDFEADLPSFLLDIDSHNEYYDRSADLEADIPSLTASIGGGAGLINSLPSLTLEFEGDSGSAIEFDASLPSLTAEWYVGSQIIASLSALSLSAALSKNELAELSASIPALQFLADVYSGTVATISGSIPSLSLSIDGDSALTVELTNNLPTLTIAITGLAGNLIDIDCTLPILKSRISSIITGDNELEASLPMFTALMESGDLSGVLRYVKGAVR